MIILIHKEYCLPLVHVVFVYAWFYCTITTYISILVHIIDWNQKWLINKYLGARKPKYLNGKTKGVTNAWGRRTLVLIIITLLRSCKFVFISIISKYKPYSLCQFASSAINDLMQLKWPYKSKFSYYKFILDYVEIIRCNFHFIASFTSIV